MDITNEEIAYALMDCKTKFKAAELLGIDRRTLYNRLKDSDLQAMLAALRADRLKERIRAFDDVHEKALDTLREVLESETASTADRIRAAALVLSEGRAARQEFTEIERAAAEGFRKAAKEEADRRFVESLREQGLIGGGDE